MTYTFKLSRRLAILQFSLMVALLVLVLACTDGGMVDNTAVTGPASAGESSEQVETSPRTILAEVNQRVQVWAVRRLGADQAVRVGAVWSASGGTISPDGTFSASSSGTYKVARRGRGGGKKSDTTTVVVIDTVPNIVAVEVSPDSAYLQPSQNRTFAALGDLSDGSTAPVGIVWSAAGGTIDAGGNYVAGTAPGRYQVIATNVSGTLADTAVVSIVAAAPTLAQVTLTPATVSLSPGGTQQFAVQGQLSDGSSVTVAVQYSGSGGTVSSSGLFTAGTTPGNYRVIATSASGPADTSTVTVAATAPAPGSGTVIYPGTDIQAVVSANPSGAAFVLKAGVHRLQQVAPKDGDSFTGRAAPSSRARACSRILCAPSSYWVAGGQTQQGAKTDSSPLRARLRRLSVGRRTCSWMTSLLLRVTSLGQVTAGRWFFDYASDQIFLGDDPAGRRVETSVLPFAFGGRASGVTLRQLVIEKYAAPAQAGAVQGDDAPGWQIQDIEVRQSHAIGIRIGDRWSVRGCRVHDNGQLGLARGGVGSVIEGCDIYRNKTVPFKTGFAGGALKFAKSSGLIFRGNTVRDNMGNGIWMDIDNIDYQIHNNTVYNNAGQGIFIEISYGGKVFNNKVYRNGFGRSSSWLYGAGILVAASPNVEVYGNEVTDNANGITAIQQNRGSGAYGPHEISNLFVHDNVVSMTQGKSGLAQTVGDNSYFTSRQNRWARNTYRLGGNAQYFAWSGLSLTESAWKGAGQDVDGTFQR